MKKMMIPVLATVALFFVAVGVNAENRQQGNGQGYYSQSGGKHGRGHHGRFGKKHGVDPVAIKVKLNLSEAQLPAWSAWKDQVDLAKDQQQENRYRMRESMQSGNKPSVVEKSQIRIDHLQQRLESARKIHAAFTDFYNVLTAEQKSELDNMAQKRKGKGKGRGRFNQPPSQQFQS